MDENEAIKKLMEFLSRPRPSEEEWRALASKVTVDLERAFSRHLCKENLMDSHLFGGLMTGCSRFAAQTIISLATTVCANGDVPKSDVKAKHDQLVDLFVNSVREYSTHMQENMFRTYEIMVECKDVMNSEEYLNADPMQREVMMKDVMGSIQSSGFDIKVGKPDGNVLDIEQDIANGVQIPKSFH